MDVGPDERDVDDLLSFINGDDGGGSKGGGKSGPVDEEAARRKREKNRRKRERKKERLRVRDTRCDDESVACADSVDNSNKSWLKRPERRA